MFRRTPLFILAQLLLAAAGCAQSADDSSHQPAPGPYAMVADASANELPDGGTATNPASDASMAGDASTDASDTLATGQLGPPDQEPIPDCPSSPVDFDTQPPASPTGLVAIDLSSWLQPVGVQERAHIRVTDEQYKLDKNYNGDLSWLLPHGVEIVDSTSVTAGEADVTFRFTRTGTFKVQASLSNDPRAGRAEVVAYESQLPIWELAVDPTELDAILATPGQDIWINGALTIDSVSHNTRLRLHGASSRYFSKKSFRFDLLDYDPKVQTYGDKIVLRAEFNDKTQLRNWLALRLVRDSTTVPTSRSYFVHFRINNRYYGLMHNVERVSPRFMALWRFIPSGSLYEADPPLELSSPGGNLTPLRPEVYPMVYQHHAGAIDYLDLRTLIEDTLTLPDNEFEQIADTEIAVDEYIQYLAAQAAIQDQDQVRKNFYLYRDPDEKEGWYVVPWDLDLTFGHLWSKENDVLEEKIVTDGDIFVGAYDAARGGYYNQMTERVLRVPQYRARFRSLVEEMLNTSMTRTNADMLMQAAIGCMRPDLIADARKRATNAEYQGRVTEILDFLDARRDFVRALPK